MFSDCRKYLPRDLFFYSRGNKIVTTDKFKYPSKVATIIDKTALPGGFEERLLVKIKYENEEEEIIECTHESYRVKQVM